MGARTGGARWVDGAGARGAPRGGPRSRDRARPARARLRRIGRVPSLPRGALPHLAPHVSSHDDPGGLRAKSRRGARRFLGQELSPRRRRRADGSRSGRRLSHDLHRGGRALRRARAAGHRGRVARDRFAPLSAVPDAHRRRGVPAADRQPRRGETLAARNGAFLFAENEADPSSDPLSRPPSEPLPPSAIVPAPATTLQSFVDGLARLGGADYARHVTRWNDNCVFCHNVSPNPGRDETNGAFRTEVAEMGIACEACHGPGAAHARANADPVRRYVLHLGRARRSDDRESLAAVARARRGSVRALPRPAHRRPRRSLPRSRRPLRARRRSGAVERAAVAGHADGRRARAVRPAFLGRWDRAAHRLRIPGAVAVTLHAAWGADLHQLSRHARRRSARPAVSGCDWRRRLRRLPPRARPTEARSRHSHHAGRSQQSRGTCIDCHMPRVVYGVLDVHRSHRIEVPDPGARGGVRPPRCLYGLSRRRDTGMGGRRRAPLVGARRRHTGDARRCRRAGRGRFGTLSAFRAGCRPARQAALGQSD